jgi:hypothetical protein
LELAAREPDTASLRLRLPTQRQPEPDRRVPRPARPPSAVKDPNLSYQARRPTHTTLNGPPDLAGLPVPHRSRAAGRPADSRAGDHRLILPGGTPADRTTHDRSGGEAPPPPPKQGRMTAPAPPRTPGDSDVSSSQLERLDPELDNRSTFDSIHRCLTPHGTRHRNRRTRCLKPTGRGAGSAGTR